MRARLPRSFVAALKPGEDERLMAAFRAKHADPAYRAEDAAQILLRKNWAATGSFLKEDRAQALDLLGFESQLVFNTFVNQALLKAERARRRGLRLRLRARAQPRHARLLRGGPPPARDVLRAAARLRARPRHGAARRSRRARRRCSCRRAARAATHRATRASYPVWAQAVEAGLPVVFHVGGGIRAADDRLLDRDYFANGGPPVPDFHGGDENFRSIDYMAIPTAPMQTIATLIFDGVLDRFPTLKLGVIEQGASWIPSWMRFMESAFEAFRKNEERLQKLALRPSEYVRRQVRATPYPAEDVGWIVANAGDEVCLFSSDYPHVEGGRNPIKRFEESMSVALRAAEAALLRRQLRRPDGARAARLADVGRRFAMSPPTRVRLRGALARMLAKLPPSQRPEE